MRRTSSHHRPPPGQRQLRVGEQIRHILVDILRAGKLRDPALFESKLITVTSVEIGPDLKHAFAYVMPLGGKNAEEIVEALNHASGYFRTEVGKHLNLRHTPKMSFEIDKTFEEAEHINNLLQQERVQRDLRPRDEDDE